MDTLRILKRHLTDDELDTIIEQSIKDRDTFGSQALWLADLQKLKASLAQFDIAGNLRAFGDSEGHLVGILIFDVGELWWSDCLVLSELFVFCVDRRFHGFARVAVQELENLAVIFNCKLIVAGNFFMEKPALTTNTYRKAGFSITCPSYIKIKHEEG